MKKVIPFVLAIIVVLALSGYSGSIPPPNPSQSQELAAGENLVKSETHDNTGNAESDS